MAINKMETALKEVIRESVISCGFLEEMSDDQIVIEIPKDLANGDYSSNVAMQLTKILKKNPRDIANELVLNINKEKAKILDIVIAGPGFINFFLDKSAMTSIICEVLQEQEKYGHTNFGQGVKYNIEYVSANPTGDLHLGHAKCAAVGDSVIRIMNAAGYDAIGEYYVNDAGNQINNLAISIYYRYLALFGIEKELPADGYAGSDVIDIANQIKDLDGNIHVDAGLEQSLPYFREMGIKLELEKIKKTLNHFGVRHDVWFHESTVYKENKIIPAIEKLKDGGYTYELEGALWLRSTDFGDDKDRVLIKSDGTYTYLTPDIAYHLNKLDRGYAYLVDLLGADHHGYIQRMKAAIQALGYNSDQLEIDIMQMVRMTENGEVVKMSKRTGNAVTIQELIDDIGVDATRYFFVSKAANTPFDFDITLAKSKSSENPVYYAQYAHARMCSIMAQATSQGLALGEQYTLLNHEKEIELVKFINEFRNVIVDSAKLRMPHKIANYIQKLAMLFHSFYNECHVIDKENIELSKQRLALVEASRITLKNALELLGVSAPTKM